MHICSLLPTASTHNRPESEETFTNSLKMTNLPLTTSNLLDTDFDFVYPVLYRSENGLLEFQGNSASPAQQWTDSTMSVERMDSAFASRSSTISTYPDSSTYHIDNTAHFEVGDGNYSYFEYVPELLGLPITTDHHVNNELPVAVSGTAEERPPPVSIHSSPKRCPQGCGATSVRPQDITRHLKEQHKCALRRCQDKTFRTRIERDKHEQSHGDEVLGFQCGNCGLKGVQNRFVRPEKLKGHFKSRHKTPIDFEYKKFQCLETSCLPDSDGGTFFTSRSELELHIHSKHTSKIEGILSADDEEYASLVSSFPDSCRKHNLVQEPRPQPKRHMGSQARALFDRQPSTPPFELTLTEPIKLLDICNLVEDVRLPGLLHRLKAINVSAVFVRSIMAIQLCGARALEAKTFFEALLLVKAVHVPTLSDKPLRKLPLCKKSNTTNSIQLLPVHASEDKEAIGTWQNHIAPALTDILEDPSIGDTCSATLVRQKGTLGNFEPVIRIQSVFQFQIIRDTIRKRIGDICSKNHRPNIPVVFSKGRMVPLVKGPSSQKFPEDDPDDRDIPHELRYYAQPGMGVSIGMTQCGHTSATSGGYILVNNQTVMLTVQHLTQSVQECEHRCGAGNLDNSLSSPARSDIEDLKETLEGHLVKLTLMMQQSGSVQDRISVDDVSKQFSEILVQVKHIKNIQAHLAKPKDDYKFGKLIDQSAENDLVPPLRIRGGCDNIMRHKMDWAIYEINKEREGKNRFRHPVGMGVKVSMKDIENEITNKYGTGEVCESWREFEVGETVYYVGSCSGYREGIINGTYGDFKHLGGHSQEWFIMPSIPVESEEEVQGDSGAWIISKRDHKLVGLLWAYDDGNIIFTPISDIFDQIAKKRGGALVQVAPLDPSRARQSRNLTPISKNRGKKSSVKRSSNSTNIKPLSHIDLDGEISIYPETPLGPLTPDHLATRSVSPTPSLTSSGFSTQDRSASRSSSPTPSLVSSVSSLSEPPSPSIRSSNGHYTMPFDSFEKLDISFRSNIIPSGLVHDPGDYPTQIMSEDLVEAA